MKEPENTAETAVTTPECGNSLVETEQAIFNIDTVRKLKYDQGFKDPDAYYMLLLANGSSFQPVIFENPAKYRDVKDCLKSAFGDSLSPTTHTIIVSGGRNLRVEISDKNLDKKIDMPEPAIIEIFARQN